LIKLDICVDIDPHNSFGAVHL